MCLTTQLTNHDHRVQILAYLYHFLHLQPSLTHRHTSPLEQYLTTINITITSHTSLQNARLDQILHKTKDHTITASRSHNIHSNRQELLMQRNVAEISRLSQWEYEIRPAPERTDTAGGKPGRRRRWPDVLVAVVDGGFAADVEHDTRAAGRIGGHQDLAIEPAGEGLAFGVLGGKRRGRVAICKGPAGEGCRVDEGDATGVRGGVVGEEGVADERCLFLADDDGVC